MMKKVFLIILTFAVSVGQLSAQNPNVDVLIKGAWVFDGLGNDSVLQDIGITKDRISYIGNSQQDQVKARKVIDAKGMYLAPGFIDTHTHADRWFGSEEVGRRAVEPWLHQGVTTLFAGNDGFGPYKIAKGLEEYNSNGIGANVYLFVGFGSVRRAVLGSVDVQPTPAQLQQMKKLVADGMKEGAIGFSTGLLYNPQQYAKTPEIIELSKVASAYGGIYDTHMRSESNSLIKSINEVLEIGQAANIPLHISHIKVSGRTNWGNSTKAIQVIEDARRKGVNITANQYPFVASMTGLKSTMIPAWAQSGGNKAMVKRFDNPADLEKIKNGLRKRDDQANQSVFIVSKEPAFEKITGRSLYDLAKEWDMPVEDAVIRILKINAAVSAITFTMSDEDIENFVRQPWVMTGSDGGGIHPRTYASFTKILEEYVLKKKLLSMAWAIHRATGLTAKTFNLKGRGVIAKDNFADIIVFDPAKLKVHSTFEKAEQLSEGMNYVFVNGILAIDQGKYKGKLAGRALKKD